MKGTTGGSRKAKVWRDSFVIAFQCTDKIIMITFTKDFLLPKFLSQVFCLHHFILKDPNTRVIIHVKTPLFLLYSEIELNMKICHKLIDFILYLEPINTRNLDLSVSPSGIRSQPSYKIYTQVSPLYWQLSTTLQMALIPTVSAVVLSCTPYRTSLLDKIIDKIDKIKILIKWQVLSYTRN